MDDSILNSVKKSLMGVTENYEAFDDQILLHINGAFSTLNQLGVGPKGGYYIEDDSASWSDYLGDNETLLGMVKPYLVNKVKMAFDPPSSSFVLTSLEKQTQELEWRIRVMIDEINIR